MVLKMGVETSERAYNRRGGAVERKKLTEVITGNSTGYFAANGIRKKAEKRKKERKRKRITVGLSSSSSSSSSCDSEEEGVEMARGEVVIRLSLVR